MKSVPLLIAGAIFLHGTVPGLADGLRVRGEIKALSDSTVTIENAAGQSSTVTLTDPVVLLYTDIALADVPDNAYVSVPSIPLAGGNRRALGLNVFPEKMRGLNEGFKPWDLTADSGMTNATVARIVSRGGENVVTVAYGEDTQTIHVPDTVPVTTFAPTDSVALAVGMKVVVFAEESGGTVTGKFVGVHENGGLPPL